ncbi:MAG: tetratricopeptide repeat protein, partial [Alphaproteobacteria bacterium]
MIGASSNRFRILAATAFCGLMLFGCQSNGSQTAMYQQALESRQEITSANANEAVQLYERLYARNSSDIGITVKYAEALRKAGMPQQALTVLSPLAESQMKAKPAVLVEYAAANIAVGRFMHAQHALD